MKAILFDIDGTLSNLEHRRHFVEGGSNRWEEFFREIPNDLPIEPTVDLACDLIDLKKKAVLIVTGRPETTRILTEAWLKKVGIHLNFSTRLFMRKNRDHREDHVVKRDLLDDIRRAGFEPVLVFDDRRSVVEMWRSEGIVVGQMAPGEF